MRVHDVQFRWERRPSEPAAEALRQMVNGVLERLERPASEVHILVTDNSRIRKLNLNYRDIDEPTDILSFPDGDDLPTGRQLLGQLVISLDMARAQAERADHGELRELEELTIHGVLHLLGYDHVMDDGEMDRLELRLRRDVLT